MDSNELLPNVRTMIEALETGDKELFLESQTEDVVWDVEGQLVPVSPTTTQSIDLIPFSGTWTRTEASIFPRTLSDFFDVTQESLDIADVEILDLFQNDDLAIARVQMEATVEATGAPFDVDLHMIMDLEDSDAGQDQVKSVEVIYNTFAVAEAFAGETPSPEASELYSSDPIQGEILSVNPDADSEETAQVVQHAFDGLVQFGIEGVEQFAGTFTEDAVTSYTGDPSVLPIAGLFDGSEGVADLIFFSAGIFAPININPKEFLFNGDRAAVVVDIGNLPTTTNIPVESSSVWYVTVEDDSITNLQFSSDTYALTSSLAGDLFFIDEENSIGVETPIATSGSEDSTSGGNLAESSENVSLDSSPIRTMLEALETGDKQLFLAQHTDDIVWKVDGQQVPTSTSELESINLIPFAGNWNRLSSVFPRTLSDFFDTFQDSLHISDLDLLDVIQNGDLAVARVNLEVSVEETDLPFEIDMSLIIELEESDQGQEQIKEVEVIYNTFAVAEAFSGNTPSSAAIELDANDPLKGENLSINPDSDSELTRQILQDAYDSLGQFDFEGIQGFTQTFAPDAVTVYTGDPSALPVAEIIEGPQAFFEYIVETTEILAPNRQNQRELLVDGDRAAVILDVGVVAPTTNIPITYTSVHFLTLEDGLISNLQLSSDTYSLSSALAGELLFVDSEEPTLPIPDPIAGDGLSLEEIFDESYYLEVNPAASTAVAQGEFANGLEHFESVGLEAGLRFTPLIDLDYYKRVANPDLAELSNGEALAHLLDVGLEEGRTFSQLVDLSFYKETHPELSEFSNSEALVHLRDIGLDAGLSFSSFVDLEEYRSYSSSLSELSLSETFSELATFFAPEDEGRIRFPLSSGLSIPDELQVITPDMTSGSADVTITYSKSSNEVILDLDLDGLPYRETFARNEDVSTPFNQQPVVVEDAAWQVWIVGEWFTAETNFWYDGQTGDLLGSEFDLFDELPAPGDSLDVNGDGVFDTALLLPTAQAIGSPIFEGNPDGSAQVQFEYSYDQLLDERGTAGTYVSALPYNLNRPQEVGIYYTEGGLPVEEAMTWDDILENVRGGNLLNITLSVEPDPKPQFLDSRPNTMEAWNALYPTLIPEGIVLDALTNTHRFAEPIDLVSHNNEPWPAGGATVARETETIFGGTAPDEFDATDPSDGFDGNRDTLFTSAGDDFIDVSQATAPLFARTLGQNYISSGTGVDEVLASYGDRVFGGAGNDILDGSVGSGDNRLSGGLGNDELFAGSSDRLFGGDGDDLLDATAGSGDNRLYGQEGNDTFFAGSGDRLLGGAGDDAFFVGDGGDNLITGGPGSDAFWISTGEFITTPNTITDFELGSDVIGVAGLDASSVEELTLTQQGDDTLISVSGFDLATLLDTAVTDLQDSNNFVFAPSDDTSNTPPTSEDTPEVQVVQNFFEAIATTDKESFLSLQTTDVDWHVDGGLLPFGPTEIQEINLIPFAGAWSGTGDESDESVGDFFDELQESLSISNFEPLDILQDDDLILARVNLEATVNETGLPFDLDVSFVVDLEESETGQSKIESVEMIYQAIRVAQAFADVPPSPEAVSLDARDPLTGTRLSVNPGASAEESRLVVENAYFNNFLVGDIEGFRQSFTEDGVILNGSDPLFFPPGGVYEGREEIGAFLSRVGTTLETTAFGIPSLIAEADRVALIGDVESNARATGISADFRVVHWLTVDDGAISNFQISSNTYFTASAIAGEPLFV